MEPSRSETVLHKAVQLYGTFYSETKSDDHRIRVMTTAELACDWIWPYREYPVFIELVPLIEHLPY